MTMLVPELFGYRLKITRWNLFHHNIIPNSNFRNSTISTDDLLANYPQKATYFPSIKLTRGDPIARDGGMKTSLGSFAVSTYLNKFSRKLGFCIYQHYPIFFEVFPLIIGEKNRGVDILFCTEIFVASRKCYASKISLSKKYFKC